MSHNCIKSSILNIYSAFILIILTILPVRLFAEYYIFNVVVDNRSIICGKELESDKINALIETKNNNFLTYSAKIKILKRRINKNYRINARKLKNTVRRLKSLRSIDNQYCYDEYTSNPNPTPTSTPTNNFDDYGNTIRGAFSIPFDLTGNINTGRTIYLRNCIGCHLERTFRNYNEITSALNTVPEMNNRLDEYELRQAIADITAYLNR